MKTKYTIYNKALLRKPASLDGSAARGAPVKCRRNGSPGSKRPAEQVIPTTSHSSPALLVLQDAVLMSESFWTCVSALQRNGNNPKVMH